MSRRPSRVPPSRVRPSRVRPSRVGPSRVPPSRVQPPSIRSVHVAVVDLDNTTVIVVEVKPHVVADPFEAQLALTALELTCGYAVVLWATEPCGCRELFGRREHIWPIERMPIDELEWFEVELDFARPTRLVPPRRSDRPN